MIAEYNGKKYNARHGGPFDRGSADSYYGRPRVPHYFVGGSYMSDEVTREEMTETELEEYRAGYDYNERYGDKKNWD